MIFNNTPIIDNPLRIPRVDKRVVLGDIVVQKHKNLGGGSIISILNQSTYIGPCKTCPDQCGVKFKKLWILQYTQNRGISS